MKRTTAVIARHASVFALLGLLTIPAESVLAWCRAMGGYPSFEAQAAAQARARQLTVQVTADQSALKKLGYYQGEADGQSSVSYGQAVAEFRRVNSLGRGSDLDARSREILNSSSAVTKEQSVQAAADQQALRTLGFFRGEPDGVPGVSLQTAIADFRKVNSLGAGGTLDAGSRAKLNTGNAFTKQDSLQTATDQRALKLLGYYQGEVDGVPGTIPQPTIVAFQRAHGLSTNANLDVQARSVLSSTNAISNQHRQDLEALRKLGYYTCPSNTPPATPASRNAIATFRSANKLEKAAALDEGSRAVLHGGKAVSKQAWDARPRWWQFWK